ncbi:MAG TPA: hypothetical protein VFN75_11085 [Pseudonocardiaceae bacterium]|nr:hypothetical protein [Pseudonocardiaceae bacterium]
MLNAAGYVQALKDYDTAFATFFDRLSRDGITTSNTQFVVTSDENDHFVGGTPSPAGCDGVHTPCTYSQIGEINANVRGLLATQQNITTPFQVHADSAPNFYLDGNPARDATTTRTFEHGVSQLTAVNPLTGSTDHFATSFADSVGMKLLHMITGDPARTPTFTAFADPNYYAFAGAANCTTPCVTEQPGFAWNHGDFAPDINAPGSAWPAPASNISASPTKSGQTTPTSAPPCSPCLACLTTTATTAAPCSNSPTPMRCPSHCAATPPR